MDDVGSVFFTNSELNKGYYCLNGEVKPLLSLSTLPVDMSYITNADTSMLKEAGLPGRYLPENYFSLHLHTIISLLGIDCLKVDWEDREGKGVGSYFSFYPEKDEESVCYLMWQTITQINSIITKKAGQEKKNFILSMDRLSKCYRSYFFDFKKEVHGKLSYQLNNIVQNESEYFIRIPGKAPSDSQSIQFIMPPSKIARHFILDDDNNYIKYPSGVWSQVKSKENLTIDFVVNHVKPLIVRAQITSIPEEWGRFYSLGSGAQSGRREFFTQYEIILLAKVGADITFRKNYYMCDAFITHDSDSLLPIKGHSDDIDDISLMTGLVRLNAVLSVGLDKEGKRTMNAFWQRGIDRSLMLSTCVKIDQAIKAECEAMNAQIVYKIFGYYLGQIWISARINTKQSKNILYLALQKSGFIAIKNDEYHQSDHPDIPLLQQLLIESKRNKMTLDLSLLIQKSNDKSELLDYLDRSIKASGVKPVIQAISQLL